MAAHELRASRSNHDGHREWPAFRVKRGVAMSGQLDQLCIDTPRFLSVDALQKANSGHPGMPLGAAPMACALWTRQLKYNPHNRDCADRDRFVLSARHGSMLHYSFLHLTSYDLSLEDLKNFRYLGDRGDMLGIERFDASAPAAVLLPEYGFTVANVVARARKLLASIASRPTQSPS